MLHEVTFNGVNFDGTIADIEVYVDGKLQLVADASSTQIVVNIIDIDDLTPQSIQVYLPSGSPKIADGLDMTFTLLPYLILVDP
mmetsp:Transcript_29263/g.28391  ORF Transcript_29263/g.28391 Transcript_29263/m.28391 type:complete len:84 (-) Transcript_29263:198-449(-)